MPATSETLFVCDFPECLGGPTQATRDEGDSPPGWVLFRGEAVVGGVTVHSENYFCSVPCAGAWFATEVEPGLLEMGARAAAV